MYKLVLLFTTAVQHKAQDISILSSVESSLLNQMLSVGGEGKFFKKEVTCRSVELFDVPDHVKKAKVVILSCV